MEPPHMRRSKFLSARAPGSASPAVRDRWLMAGLSVGHLPIGSEWMIRAIATVLTTLLLVCGAGHASQSESGAEHQVRTGTSHGDEAVAVTFADLQSTVETLKRAQSATEKYLDVSTAEADGY